MYDNLQTIDEVVDMICDGLDEEGYEFVINNNPSSIHHGAGRRLRNECKLWDRESPIVQDAIEKYGIGHADDISGLIYRIVWAKIKKEDVGETIINFLAEITKHWKMFGLTPLTA